MSRLGDAIRKARIAKKWSEKQLGRKCGMAENVIREIESGRRIVSDDQAQRILKLLGAKNPVSTELEVAQEPEVKLRPQPRAYVLPAKNVAPEQQKASDEATDAWLDALGGVVKRVPIMDEGGVVIDHRLMPVIGGKIEGGHPDKVLFYRCPDNSMRGFRMFAGDLLLTVPAAVAIDDAIMLVQLDGRRVVRKIKKQDGGRLLLQSYESEFECKVVSIKDVLIVGHCVRLERAL